MIVAALWGTGRVCRGPAWNHPEWRAVLDRWSLFESFDEATEPEHWLSAERSGIQILRSAEGVMSSEATPR